MINKLIFLLACSLILFGCSDNALTLDGKLVYSVSNKIIEVDLKSKDKGLELYKADKDNIYNYLNSKSKREFIVENYNIKQGYQIEIIDVVKGQSKFVVKGTRPLYFADKNVLFFIRKNELCMTSTMDIENESTVLRNDVHEYSKPPIRISVHEIAYYNHDNKISIVNVENKKTRLLDMRNCIPWGFVPESKVFVCKSQENGDFLLVDLVNSQNANKIEIDDSDWGVRENIVITNDSKYLIYSKVRKNSLSEKQDVFVYDLRNKKEYKYLSNRKIASGVYRNAGE